MPDCGAVVNCSTSGVIDSSTMALQLPMQWGSDQRSLIVAHVEVEVGVGELQQVEEEQRHVRMGERGVIGLIRLHLRQHVGRARHAGQRLGSQALRRRRASSYGDRIGPAAAAGGPVGPPAATSALPPHCR
jgi:hypothetical protein